MVDVAIRDFSEAEKVLRCLPDSITSLTFYNTPLLLNGYGLPYYTELRKEILSLFPALQLSFGCITEEPSLAYQAMENGFNPVIFIGEEKWSDLLSSVAEKFHVAFHTSIPSSLCYIHFYNSAEELHVALSNTTLKE